MFLKPKTMISQMYIHSAQISVTNFSRDAEVIWDPNEEQVFPA